MLITTLAGGLLGALGGWRRGRRPAQPQAGAGIHTASMAIRAVILERPRRRSRNTIGTAP